jgi:acyl phosphate:glycerol-3-phosphate acyltransferase
MDTTILYIVIAVVSYLLGSLPTAYLLTLFVKKVNIFDVGSGNMGGTNVARTMGLGWGIITGLCDVSKGMLAVYVAQRLVPQQWLTASIIAAVFAVCGHNWSFFGSIIYTLQKKSFQIRGGKGAATAFGTMLMLLPPAPLITLLAIAIVLALITRYASLSVLVSFSVALIWTIIWSIENNLSGSYVPYAILIAILIAWRFRENIQRLLAGNERKLGERVS